MNDKSLNMSNIKKVRRLLNLSEYGEDRNIRNKIIVKPIQIEYGRYHYIEFNIDILEKRYLNNWSGVFDFKFNKFRGYYADFLLQGLRICNEEDLSLILFYLYFKEVKQQIINAKYYDYFGEIEYEITTYLKEVYDINFGSTLNYISNIINCGNLEHLKKIVFLNYEEALEFFCEMCYLQWSEFFSNYILIEANMKETMISHANKYYDPSYIGYIVKDNEKVLLEEVGINITYKSISVIILSKRFSQEQINSGAIGYLDCNPMNTEENNVVLFRSNGDLVRYQEGNKNINQDSFGMVYIDVNINKEEFAHLYKKYSLSKLCKILNTTRHYINKYIREFDLPRKSDL